ncbi:MAG: sigma-70 family RNA polymerase sigma factor [Thermoguttaceae bacterium]|nr:sigma-70 family RNA polymerase sigma factor [Thermoguttaceae bacterium]
MKAEGTRYKTPPAFISLDGLADFAAATGEAPAEIAEAREERRKQRAIIQKALDALKPRQRKALFLRLEGATPREISKALNVSNRYGDTVARRFIERVNRLL